MNEDLIESVAPQLFPPVSWQPISDSADTDQPVFGITTSGFTLTDESDE